MLPFCVNFVALLSRFSRIWFRRKKVLAGGGNLVQVFLHLVRLIDVGGSQSGKADDRIHPKKQILFRNGNGKQREIKVTLHIKEQNRKKF